MGRPQRERQGTTGASGVSAADPDLTAIEHALGAAWLRAALESTRGFVAVHDVDATLRYVSPTVTAVLGHAPEDLTGPVPTHLVHPDDLDPVINTMTRVVDEPCDVETLTFRAAHVDGSWRWLETQVVNLVDHPGVQGVVTSSWDITGRSEEREHAAAARRSGEERFRALAEHSSDIVAVYDAGGTLKYMSPSAERFFGVEAEDAVGRRSLLEYVHPDDRHLHNLQSLRAQSGTGPPRLVRVRNHRGEWRWLEAVTTNLLDDENIRGFVTNSRDVTAQQEAEEAMRHNEKRFRAMAQHVSDIVAVLDAEGTLVYSSPSATRTMGYGDGERLQRNALELVHPDDLDEIGRIFDLVLAKPGPTKPIWVRVAHADGSWRWFEAIANNLLDEPAVGGIVVHARDVTEQHDAAQALRRSERRYRGIVEDQSELICRYQADTTLTFVNEAYARDHDRSVKDLVGTRFLDVIPEEDREFALKMIGSLTPENPVVTYVHRVRTVDGDIRWHQWTDRVVLDDEGGIAEYQAVGRDITDQRIAEEAAVKSEALANEQARVLQLITTSAPLDEILQEMCRVVELHVTGARCSIELLNEDGTTARRRSVTAPPERSWSKRIASSVDRRTLGTLSLTYDHPRRPDVEHKKVVDLFEDLAAIAIERKRYEARLAYQAQHDPLTDLPNRTLFLEFLQLALARTRRRHDTFAVLFFDLDRFKVVNDSLGHDAGDELLVALARRLRGVVRPGDTVARFGGDEFTVLCDDLPLASARDYATDVAERLLQTIRRPFLLDGEEQFLSASIGIALAGPGTERPEGLLRDADAAMYRAKERGKDRWELFDELMRATARERHETENALHRALERNELRVHYQPVVSLHDRSCIGAEALVRWAHPDRGLLAPAQFIDLAEETGLILPAGRWVIEEACRRSREWRVEHGPGFVVSVNLSSRQLSNPDLVEHVRSALDDTGADAAGLCFEITENVLMDDAEATMGAITALKRLGVGLSIDDFGTGYSSLGYLKRFPVGAVKVDRSFIDGLGSDPEDSAIVAAVIGLGHALGLTVIAEGVETDRQLAELAVLGCDAAQGYLFARPGPGADVAARIDRSGLAPLVSRTD
jgi:diguanylate cyclase (GGDEF)-like protein/PAS domain S-box-containing protein